MTELTINLETRVQLLGLYRDAIGKARGAGYHKSQADAHIDKMATRLEELVDILEKTRRFLVDRLGVTGLILAPATAFSEDPRERSLVHDLKWNETARGRFVVYLNGDSTKPISLTRQELGFLKFLASNRPDPRDGLTATRSLDELVAYLSNGKSKTNNPKRYVNHMVSRIRFALAKAGLDPDLVKRDECLGARFAFRANL